MTGFEAYNVYNSLNIHFKDPRFDFYKYNGKTNAKFATFESYPSKWVFEKLARDYPNRDNLTDFILANLIERKNIGWPGDLLDEDAKEAFYNWKKRIDGLTYNFNQDCAITRELLEHRNKKLSDLFKVPKNSFPPIVSLFLEQNMSLETLTLIDSLLMFSPFVNKYLKDDFIWQDLYLRITKYRPFLLRKCDIRKIRKVLKDQLTIWTSGLGGRSTTAREEFAFRQMADKANNALADNAVLVIEVNDLRKELRECYQEISALKFELRAALGVESLDIFEDATPVECETILAGKLDEQDKKTRGIPVPKIPKSVKTNRVPRKRKDGWSDEWSKGFPRVFNLYQI